MKLLFSATLLALAAIACCQDCNFDANRTSDQRCGWSNEYSDDFDWSVRRLPSPTPFTGPSGDHTTGSGNYLYTEASGRTPGEKARIYSPFDSPANVAGSNITMISFWFSMWDIFGGGPFERTNMGTLNVYITYGGETAPTDPPVWSRSGQQTDRSGWKEAKIIFTARTPFRIIFEGVIGDGERSDIGIDDVMVKQPEMPSTCDFEGSELGDLCFFFQEDLTDDFDWSRHSGETPSLDTGPLSDHTIGDNTGHYMYIETTRQDEPATAILKSLTFFKDNAECFVDFYYHAFGSEIGGLTMNVQLISDTERVDLPYPIVEPGDSGNDTWIHVTRQIEYSATYYELSFNGSRGGGNLGDIAIDDISLSDGCFYADYCSSNPCRNGATCRLNIDGQPYCSCAGGWTGPTCEEDIEYCIPDRCAQWEICEELQGGWDCKCHEGYQGTQCQDRIPTVEPPEPIDIRISGVDPEAIPVIIGSCVGSFILLVTAAWFTASCIRNDGYRRKAQAIEGVKNLDVEEGDENYNGEEGGSNAYINTTYDPDDPDDESKNKASTSSSENVAKGVDVVEEVQRGSDTKREEASESTEEESNGDRDMEPLAYEDAVSMPSGSGENKKADESVKEDVNEDVKDGVKDGKESEKIEEVETKGKDEDVHEVEKKTPTDLSTKYDDDVATEKPDESEENGEVAATAAPDASGESKDKEAVLTTSL